MPNSAADRHVAPARISRECALVVTVRGSKEPQPPCAASTASAARTPWSCASSNSASPDKSVLAKSTRLSGARVRRAVRRSLAATTGIDAPSAPRALATWIRATALSPMYRGGRPRPGLVLVFGGIAAELIPPGVAVVADAVRSAPI